MRTNKKLLAIIIVILFACSTICLPAQIDEKNRYAGYPQGEIDGLEVRIEGGFIKSLEPFNIIVSALGFSTNIWVTCASKSSSKTLSLTVKNIDSYNTEVKGDILSGLIHNTATSVMFSAYLAPEETKVFKLRPKKPSPDHFNFFVTGDKRAGDNVFERIIEDINNQKPLFAVMCGDLVCTGKLKHYVRFDAMLQKIGHPFYTAIGNHDIRHKGRKNYRRFFGPFYYYFDYGNAHFVFLDSATNVIDDKQFKWLEENLKNNTKKLTFVFLHHPPFDPRKGKHHCITDPNNAQQFMHLMEKYKPTRVFASHIHSYFRVKRGGVIYVITGGAGAPLEPGGFYHYILVNVDGTKVTDRLVKLSPPRGRIFYYWAHIVDNIKGRPGTTLKITVSLIIIIAGLTLVRKLRSKKAIQRQDR